MARILKFLQINYNGDTGSYHGRVVTSDDESFAEVSFGDAQVRQIMDALRYTLPIIVRVNTDYSDTFMPPMDELPPQPPAPTFNPEVS
jgi:hypothetical protein